MIKDSAKFLNIIKDLKLYLIKFKKDRSIKTTIYLNNYLIIRDKSYFITIIIYNKCIFLINDKT